MTSRLLILVDNRKERENIRSTQKKSMFRSHTSSAKNHNLSQRNGKAYNALCRLYICALSSYDLPKDLLFPLVIPLDHDHDGIAGFEVRVLVVE